MATSGPSCSKGVWWFMPCCRKYSQSEYKIHKQQPPFNAKICAASCQQTISFLRSTHFSESLACGKLWALRNRSRPRTSNRAYHCAKWRLLCLLSFKYFSQRAQFWKMRNITWIFLSFSWSIFSHSAHLDQVRINKNIWWIIIHGIQCTTQKHDISITTG